MDGATVTDELTIPEAELRESFARAGGPGGQHVNKTETKVELRWSPGASEVLSPDQKELLVSNLSERISGDGDLVVVVSSERSQVRNRALARKRLGEMVRGALRRRRVPHRRA